jgi:hypothetical protein
MYLWDPRMCAADVKVWFVVGPLEEMTEAVPGPMAQVFLIGKWENLRWKCAYGWGP